MKPDIQSQLPPAPVLPLDGPAVQLLEEALSKSPSKSILLKINDALYRLSREGRWFKFALLTKKNAIKRATVFQTLSELYNQSIHGHSWSVTPVGA